MVSRGILPDKSVRSLGGIRGRGESECDPCHDVRTLMTTMGITAGPCDNCERERVSTRTGECVSCCTARVGRNERPRLRLAGDSVTAREEARGRSEARSRVVRRLACIDHLPHSVSPPPLLYRLRGKDREVAGGERERKRRAGERDKRTSSDLTLAHAFTGRETCHRFRYRP